MIDREDMLALTRRMTVKRTSMTRIAGGYMDSDGCIDGTFKYCIFEIKSGGSREKTCRLQRKFRLQKRIKTLQEYKLQENMQNDSLWKLFDGNAGMRTEKMMH